MPDSPSSSSSSRAPSLSIDGTLESYFYAQIGSAQERSGTELPEEIDRLLSDTDVDLTYDVGHIVLAGGDGSALFDAWADRINHVHIKDVRPSVLEEARAAGREDLDAWWADVSTPLGVGDADLSSFCRTLRDSAYDGWVVIEQDRAPLTADSVEHVFAEQAANLNWLAGQLTHPTFLPTGKGNPKGTS